MREAVIVSAVRTAVGKAYRGALAYTRPDDLAAAALRGALQRVEGLDPKQVDDVVMGCAMPEGEQGMNVGRIASHLAGIPHEVPAFTINRFCSSGLQAIAIAAQQIISGWADVVLAGGTESMSMVPMGGNKIAPNPELVEVYPDIYIAMGRTAENVASRFGIKREDQDQFALESHQKAVAAIKEGRFKEEIVPVKAKRYLTRPDGRREVEEFDFDTDDGPRFDTSLEALAKLRPAFGLTGTVTAGNSSQMSLGAAAAVVMSREKAKELGIEPLAVLRSFAVGGVEPDIMGIGPVAAVPKALKLAGLKLEDIDLIELNEAFASQSLYVIRELGLDRSKVNVNGGAIALGHPLGCTGAKLTATILHEMARRSARYGLVTMCIGGGMGAAGVFEREQ